MEQQHVALHRTEYEDKKLIRASFIIVITKRKKELCDEEGYNSTNNFSYLLSWTTLKVNNFFCVGLCL